MMLQRDHPDDFVIATGTSCSLEDFVRLAFSEFDLDWRQHVLQSEALFRPTDLLVSRADPSEAHRKLGWQARTRMPEVIKKMIAGI